MNTGLLPVDIVLAPEWWHLSVCCINMDYTVDELNRSYSTSNN